MALLRYVKDSFNLLIFVSSKAHWKRVGEYEEVAFGEPSLPLGGVGEGLLVSIRPTHTRPAQLGFAFVRVDDELWGPFRLNNQVWSHLQVI